MLIKYTLKEEKAKAYGKDSIFKVSSVIIIPGLHSDKRGGQQKREEAKKERSFQCILEEETEKMEEIHDCVTKGYNKNGGRYEFVYSKREYHR